MHVKYASRHALYPPPNAFVVAPVVVTLVAARAVVFMFFVARGDVALRPVVVARAGATALRETVCVVAERAVDFEDVAVSRTEVTRETLLTAVLRDVASRDETTGVEAVRETVCEVVERGRTGSDEVVRLTAKSSRTAASATPMQIKQPKRKIQIFFILRVMVAKNVKTGQEEKEIKTKKIPSCDGIFIHSLLRCFQT